MMPAEHIASSPVYGEKNPQLMSHIIRRKHTFNAKVAKGNILEKDLPFREHQSLNQDCVYMLNQFHGKTFKNLCRYFIKISFVLTRNQNMLDITPSCGKKFFG